jgi:hypothetical protein
VFVDVATDQFLAVREGGGVTPVATESDISSISSNAIHYITYPNPIHDNVMISIDVDISSFVRIDLVDIMGRSLTRLIDRRLGPGRHDVTVNLHGFAPGLYFTRLQDGREDDHRSVIILR